jgi:hypothetical protein
VGGLRMNVIKIEGISDSYPEPIEGTFERFYCKEFNDKGAGI